MVRVLIVDDEELTREGIKKSINWKELGMELIGDAEDGDQALEVIEQQSPDILLCDIKMPGLNGIELAKIILERKIDIRIIFLSGYADKENLKSAVKLQVVDFVEKPLDPEELKAVMEKTAVLLHQQKEQISNTVRERLLANLNDETLPGNLLRNIGSAKLKSFHEIQEKFYGHSCISKTSSESTKYELTVDELDRIDHLLNNNNISGAYEIVDGINRAIKLSRDPDIKYIKNLYLTILIKFYEKILNKPLYSYSINNAREFLWDKVFQIDTFDELVSYVNRELKTFSMRISEVQYSRTVRDASRYIRDHFRDQLTIKTIAENVFVTHTYLCLLFKKEMKMTVNAYLTKIRIEEGKRLLSDRSLSILEISEKIGYPNPNYFSKIFKKNNGYTPSDYRDKIA